MHGRAPVVDNPGSGLPRPTLPRTNRVTSRVLDDRHNLGGHESGGPHGNSRPRHFGHLDRPAYVRDLDPPPGTARVDLETLDAGPDVDEDFDPVAFHDPTLPSRCKIGRAQPGWSSSRRAGPTAQSPGAGASTAKRAQSVATWRSAAVPDPVPGVLGGGAVRTALLVVDMLNDFVDGVLGNPLAKDVIAPIAQLAEQARRSPEWVVVYANDAHQPDDIELSVFPPHAMAGTPGAMVIDELGPQPGDVVVGKHFYSAFTGSGLEERLLEHDVRRLVVVGQHTDCCVRHTCYDAFVRRFELVVCPDATAIFGPGSEEAASVRQARALDYLRTYYGAALVDTKAVR